MSMHTTWELMYELGNGMLTVWNSEGYLQLRKAPQQDARPVQALRYVFSKRAMSMEMHADIAIFRSPLSPRPEAHLRQLRIPERQR